MATAAAIVFDKASFAKTLKVMALRLPTKLCSTFIKEFRPLQMLFAKPGLKSVVNAPAPNAAMKLLLLHEKILKLEDLPAHLRALTATHSIETVPYTMELNFTHLSSEAILRELLPADVSVPTSFETVGHIAHLNLREAQLPYQKLIGEVMLAKHQPQIRSVVTKVGNISNEFRFFPMELLAGDDDFECTVREHACHFRFNYREVYWNSRLQTAHNRLVEELPASSVVCDMTCGVGPFTVPLAAKGCTVYANDLNPRSFHYLLQNIHSNGVANRVHSYNMDARDFVRRLVREKRTFDQVVINLPTLSIDFLDVFVNLLPPDAAMPRIHCYCFSSALDLRADVIARVEGVLGAALTDPSVHEVRHVAPKKDMMYISFVLPVVTGDFASFPPVPSSDPSYPHPFNPSSSPPASPTPSVTSSQKRVASEEPDVGQELKKAKV
jgi:tRNA (guanine37-N1)-methyltransferase